MRSTRRLPLTPLMLAIAMPLALVPEVIHAADAPAPAAQSPAEAPGGSAIAAQAAYAEAYALYRKAAFTEAKERVDEAVRLDPANADAQNLRQDILAVLSQRDNRVQMAATWFRTLQDVSTQETVIRIGALVAAGDKKLAAGDYNGAESDYDRAEVAIRSFPYPFPWGELPAQVAGKRTEARALSRKQDDERAARARDEAREQARAQVDLQEQALATKVDELLRRAREAYSRKDFKSAEVDSWNAYELDRRREDARKLNLDARREGHDLFETKYEDERMERTARVSEEIHKSLIPQSELLVYPEDWKRRTMRSPREIGGEKDDPALKRMHDSLDLKLTFKFEDTEFPKAIDTIRELSGANINIDPAVTAAGNIPNITLDAKGMRFGDAMNWIMLLSGLKMSLQEEGIWISNEAIAGKLSLRMYDVTALIQQPRDMPGREMAYSSVGGNAGGGGGSIDLFKKDDTAVKPPNPEELVEFIKKNVSADSWDEAKGTSIEQRAGSTLFISQSDAVHKDIVQLLRSLQDEQSLQVQMDVRLLDVGKNYFEEIGFDWTKGNMLSANSNDGYTRQNNNSLFNGNVGTSAASGNGSALPSNQNSRTWGQYTNPNTPRGLVLDVSHSPFNFLSTDQLNLVFSAAENQGDVQILQQPSLSCYNGQRANASFMNQYAYISDYEVVSSNLDPKISVLTFGNIIDMRPVVSSDRKYITLEVRPSSVKLAGVFTEFLTAPRIFTNGGDNGGGAITPAVTYPLEMPNVQVQTLRSTVMLPDKANLLIGGFQHSLQENTHVGVPFLSHIPFLGRLFGRDGTYDEENKLFYLVHAEIVDLSEKEAVQ